MREMRADVVVVCGLAHEAAIARGNGVVVIAGGGDRAALERRLGSLPHPPRALISFGVAGGLDPGLVVGAVLVPAQVIGGSGERHAVAVEILEAWRSALSHVAPDERALAGIDRPALDPIEKSAIRSRTGAVAVDMESHVVAAAAGRLGVPWAVLRTVSDHADRALPPVAARAMRADGGIDLPGVLAAVARQPGQIPALLATARDAAVAFRALRRVRGLVGPRFGLDL